MMDKAIVYIHGQGGNAKEADHYKALFKDYDVVGLDYKAQTPWEAKKEFPVLLEPICKEHRAVQMVANSIMKELIEKNYIFLFEVVHSPMSKLIANKLSEKYGVQIVFLYSSF